MADNRSRVYGDGSNHDVYEGMCVYGDYLYAVGYTTEGAGALGGLIVKYDLSDLSIDARKVYSGASLEYLYGVYADANYVYVVGRTQSEGPGNYSALILKLNVSDLSIAARKYYGGTSADAFWDVYVSGSYAYAVGYTHSEGWAPAGNYSPLIVKFNVSDLSIAARRYIGGDAIGQSDFRGVHVDGSYVYCAGMTNEGLSGWNNGLIMKLNVSDLSTAAAKHYGEVAYGYSFTDVFIDGSYAYVIGTERGNMPLIIKFNISDLSIDTRLVTQVGDNGYFWDVIVDGSYIYVAGVTDSEGKGGDDCLLVRFNVSDLSTDYQKLYGTTSDDDFYGVRVIGGNVYGAGHTEGLTNNKGLVWKSAAGQVCNGDSVPSAFTMADSGRTFGSCNGTLAASSLSNNASGLTLGNSALTLSDSALTNSSPYIITCPAAAGKSKLIIIP